MDRCPTATRCEIYSGPSHRGDYHYALFWISDYHPGHPKGENRIAERGQHFFGRPPDNVQTKDFRFSRGV